MLTKSRVRQPATPGFGQVCAIPKKRRGSRESSTDVTHGQDCRVRRLKEHLAKLQAARREEEAMIGETSKGQGAGGNSNGLPTFTEDTTAFQNEMDVDMPHPITPKPFPTQPTTPRTSAPASMRRPDPDAAANLLRQQWKDLLPHLVSPLLSYLSRTKGKRCYPLIEIRSACLHPDSCEITNKKVLCLFLDHFDTFEVTSCRCQDAVETLIARGLFPTSPAQPRMAVSIQLLELHRAFFEPTNKATNKANSDNPTSGPTFAHYLNAFYEHRGFIYRNFRGEVLQNPFEQGISQAVRWYYTLKVRLDQQAEGALLAGDAAVRGSNDSKVTSKHPADGEEETNTTSELHTDVGVSHQIEPAIVAGDPAIRRLGDSGTERPADGQEGVNTTMELRTDLSVSHQGVAAIRATDAAVSDPNNLDTAPKRPADCDEEIKATANKKPHTQLNTVPNVMAPAMPGPSSGMQLPPSGPPPTHNPGYQWGGQYGFHPAYAQGPPSHRPAYLAYQWGRPNELPAPYSVNHPQGPSSHSASYYGQGYPPPPGPGWGHGYLPLPHYYPADTHAVGEVQQGHPDPRANPARGPGPSGSV